MTVIEFECELDGAMGARTKFQTKNTAQLTLKVKRGNTAAPGSVPELLPAEVLLDDDTRLDEIGFEEQRNKDRLSVVEQASVLAMCKNVKNTNPSHGITIEEMCVWGGHKIGFCGTFSAPSTSPALWICSFQSLPRCLGGSVSVGPNRRRCCCFPVCLFVLFSVPSWFLGRCACSGCRT